MNIRDLQAVLFKMGAYRGKIDGIVGPKTLYAVRIVLLEHRREAMRWPDDRRMTAAMQAGLAALGHEPGYVDGYIGHNTREALVDFYSNRLSVVDRTPVSVQKPTAWPPQSQMEDFFGKAGGPQCTAGRALLPFPFPLSWDRSQKVSKISCHEKVASAIQSIFADAVRAYGTDRFVELGLCVYGGCYNYRKMRGGKSLSTHAYGIAVDLDPDNNQLRWGRDRARFAGEEYSIFWNIVEAHGAVSLGRAANMDWMHFQFARLG